MERFGDKIAGLTYKVYLSLGKSGKPVAGKEWTVCSSFLLEKEGELEVVSLATGTKCIGRNLMSPHGDLINDAHAEVISKRGFLLYLYHQIRLAQEGKSKVLEKAGDTYKVVEGVKFHFFTSHAPCGDASIVPMTTPYRKRAADEGLGEGPIAKREKGEEGGRPLDVHRTGAKCLPEEERQDKKKPGVEYHQVGAVRTKPGRGDPTLSVSCSDKMARWIYVGIQGGLLATLIPSPIRLSSMTIGGGQGDEGSLKRVLFERAAPPHRPALLHSALPFPDEEGARPSPCAISWVLLPSKRVEVCVGGKRLGSTSKAPDKGRLSISKRMLFEEFAKVSPVDASSLTYREAKDLSHSYQSLVREFKDRTKAWTKKPPLENFTLQPS